MIQSVWDDGSIIKPRPKLSSSLLRTFSYDTSSSWIFCSNWRIRSLRAEVHELSQEV